MGFWNKLGKIALTAAPYVAAPFTGGASLMATGLANKAVQKWSEKDAQKNMAKGLAPSKFDSVLGKIGNISSTASMFIPGGQLGALGKVGQAASAAGKIGKVANIANKVNQGMGMANQVMGAIRGQGQQSPIGPSQYPPQQQRYPMDEWPMNIPIQRGFPQSQGRMNMRQQQPRYAYGR